MKTAADKPFIIIVLLASDTRARQRFANQFNDRWARVKLVGELRKQSSITALQEFMQAWHDRQIVAQGDDFVGDGAALANATGNAFHITQAVQAYSEAAAQGRTFVEFLYARETFFQLAQVEERLRQRAAQLARSHGSYSAIKNAQQTSLGGAAARTLQKVQVALCMRIQNHVAGRAIGAQTR